MDKELVLFSIRYRFLVLIILAIIVGFGIRGYGRLPVDAFPDVSPIMVPIFAEAHGMAPEEVERLITFPIESKMNGLPGVTQVKSTSAFGMAAIYVYFNDSTDIYFARQIVSERLASAMADLPDLHEPPKLGPISTGLGQIFIYYLTLEDGADTGGKAPDLFLREINDWIVKYQLQMVRGVTEILSIGGHVLQYQIRVDPFSLDKYGVSLDELIGAVRSNNRNAGGQFMVLGQEEYLVRGIGLVQSLEDIRDIHVKTIGGVPVRIGNLAEVDYGREIRRGVVSRNGEKEVVSGIVLQLFGENTSEVIKRLYAKVPEVIKSLPKGVKLVPYYEQAELVEKSIGTVKNALFTGAALVVATLFLFLGNLRCALLVAVALPVSALISVLFMGWAGLSANLMSLGGIAIAIGMLGDGTIVMIENIYRRLSNESDYEEHPHPAEEIAVSEGIADAHENCGRPLGPERRGHTRRTVSVILDSAQEVSRPIIFSIMIIVIVFLPIFSLENVEGKMFKPMAFTLTYALAGSLFMAIVLAPALATYLLKPSRHSEFVVLRILKSIYRPLVTIAVRRRAGVTILAAVAFTGAMFLLPRLGTEFIPTLEEGSIMIGVAMAPSISLEEGVKLIQSMERLITGFQPVKEVVSRIGRPEAGSHPHPVNYSEVHIELIPTSQWKGFRDKGAIVKALRGKLSEIPGVQLNFTQPIQNAFDELLSGIKAQLAIKVFGDDLDLVRAKAGEIKNAIDMVPGLVDLSVEQNFGQPQVQVTADRKACARYGINVNDILELVELAIGGEVVDSVFLNTRRFGIHVRYAEKFRKDPEAIGRLLVKSATGALIPLREVAAIERVLGPIQINREMNSRRWVIQGNVQGRDLGSVAEDIRRLIAEKVVLPPGTWIELGGQFENQVRAMRRLSFIVPLAIGLIVLLLAVSFGSIRKALLIFVTVPLALIGGVLGLYVTGEYLSVPAAVGFIALFGMGVQNGMVLVSCISQLREAGHETHEAVIHGAMLRLRPVLMTASTTVLGLLPLLLARGLGSEVQRPLATVVVFGLTSACLLTLFVIPALYGWFVGEEEA